MKTVIFAGTSEGRKLSQMLSGRDIYHTVCVATEYGSDLMGEDDHASVRAGRMDADAMEAFLTDEKKDDDLLVVDATHPYATEVTETLKTVTGRLGIRYLRIIRKCDEACADGISEYADMTECAESVDKTNGNILLTTGSKELEEYCRNVSAATLERTYVRIIPSAESIGECTRLGIRGDRIIAMQGPFGRELNEAIMKQSVTRHLITKESGQAGGFEEKVAAALSVGAKVHVIARPRKEEGVDIYEAYSVITGTDAKDGEDAIHITLAGIGMGNKGYMSAVAVRAIEKSEAVFGAARLLKNISHPEKYEMYLAADIIPVLEQKKIRNAVILFSGDTGFYSGAAGMLSSLKQWKKDVQMQVIPGISTFSYLAAKLQISYDDACFYSLHGRNEDKDIAGLTDLVRHNSRVFVLLSRKEDVRLIARTLIDSKVDCRMIIGRDLSYENETVKEMTLGEAAEYDEDGIVSVVTVNDDPIRRRLVNVIRDEDLIRDKVPMTKECIRHESIIRLNLHKGDIFYDIGGGTGSVAVEAALLDPSLRVFTIEKKSDAADLIRKNIIKHDLHNVSVIEDDAGQALCDMPKPDCVFIGGSGGKLKEIMSILTGKGSGIRYVINAVTLETIEAVGNVIKEYEPEDDEAVMISVSDVHTAGSYHMMRANDPVWIFSFTI